MNIAFCIEKKIPEQSILTGVVFFFQKLFHQFDSEKSGLMSSFDLRRALLSAGKYISIKNP